jgi:hypothetical protein
MNNEFFSVSRIEGDIVVLEFPDGSFNEVGISLLPNDVKPGNILKKNEENIFIHDFDEENLRKQKLIELQNKIFG